MAFFPIPQSPSAASLKRPFLTEPWILLCVYLNCAGWVLSALHQLNAGGYAVALMVGVLVLGALHPDFGRVRLRRFRRGFPLIFLILAALAILGGGVHPPNNYDGLAYRVPRFLHWLAEGRWHWIPTEFPRLNTRPAGWEWQAAPLLALTRSFRGLFLPNALAFLLLPGLVFSVFTRTGVRPRVAWYWMWLVPTGYCFLFQAGSIANDMLAAIPALAAVDFALRAHKSKRISDVWLSVLSAALMTGFKTTNLPLLLVWAIALLPVLMLLKERLLATVGVLLLALGASFLPLAALNQKYANDWSGLAADTPTPFRFRIPVNAILLLEQNFAPPIFPVAKQWNDFIQRIVPPKITRRLEQSFEKSAAHFTLPEMIIEEGAGLGLGLSLLLMISTGSAIFAKRTHHPTQRMGLYAKFLLLTPWVGLLFLMYKSGAATVARFATAYYALLFPALLITGDHGRIIRTRWWRSVAALTCVIALFPLVFSAARPLWPARTVLEKLDAAHSSNPLLKRAYTVYSVYGERDNGFAPARARLPQGLHKIGFLSHDDPEASLWVPVGKLKVEHVTKNECAGDLRQRGIEYILANPEKAEIVVGLPFEQWVAKIQLQTLENIPLCLRATHGEVAWRLLRLPPPPQ